MVHALVSGGTLGCKTWMNHRAVARQRGRRDDFIIPIHSERLFLLVHQDLEKGEKVSGIEARRGRGDAAGNVEMTDDLDVVDGHNLTGSGELAIATALDRKVDD